MHLFNGKNVLEKRKAKLSGRAPSSRYFVRCRGLARLVVRTPLEDPPPFRRLEIGGPGRYSDGDLSPLYARTAGIAPHASSLAAGFAAAHSLLAPGRSAFGPSRIRGRVRLTDDAITEASTHRDASPSSAS